MTANKKNLRLSAVSAPCQNCTKRYLGCHSSCEEYLAYRKQVEKENELRIKSQIIESYGIPRRK